MIIKKIITSSRFVILIVCVFLFSASATFLLLTTKTSPKAYQKKANNNFKITTAPIKPSARVSAQNYNSPLGVPILMYHHIGYLPTVGNDLIRTGLTVLPQDFTSQVQWLHDQGYNSISLSQLYLYSQKKLLLPKKPIVFTFDDGYDDALINAPKILQQFGYTGSFGIITDFPGTVNGTNTYATWNSIVAAQTAGMEIVCHTQNHFDGSNPKFTADYIFQNLSGCKQALANHAITTKILIYPYGHYTDTYLQQAKDAGFVMGLKEGGQFYNPNENIMEVTRIAVRGGESLQKFEMVLEPWLFPKVSTTTQVSIKQIPID